MGTPLQIVNLGAVELVLSLSWGDGDVGVEVSVKAVPQDPPSTSDKASEFEDRESSLVRAGWAGGGLRRVALTRIGSDTERGSAGETMSCELVNGINKIVRNITHRAPGMQSPVQRLQVLLVQCYLLGYSCSDGCVDWMEEFLQLQG